MASVRHPNVISYLGICTEPACIVTEYCAKGSLTDVSHRCRRSCRVDTVSLGRKLSCIDNSETVMFRKLGWGGVSGRRGGVMRPDAPCAAGHRPCVRHVRRCCGAGGPVARTPCTWTGPSG